MAVLRHHEQVYAFRFAIYHVARDFGNIDVYKKKHKVYWEQTGIPFDGVPFVILGSKVLDCSYGRDRQIASKIKRKERLLEINGDQGPQRKYNRVKGSKKVNCPAVASIKAIAKFPDFKIAANTESRRDTGSKALRRTIASRSELKMYRKFVVCLPHISEHKNHEMVEVPLSRTPSRPDVSSFYSDNTKGCYLAILEAMPLISAALEAIEITSTDELFCIADYGTADGGTSMPVIINCIKTLRDKYGDSLPINIVYEDRPTNDFKSLFLRVNGLIPESKSLLETFQNIYVTACGTDFYSQCLPPNYIDLGFSATAMHCLSEKPCNITDGLHHTMIQDEDERELFRLQAAKDWETILINRASEIKPGGYLVVVQFAIDSEGQYLGHTKLTKNCMFTTMTELWRQMLFEDLITMEEFMNTTFLHYYRTVEELSEPFIDSESNVAQTGMKLLHIETKVVKCPFKKKWIKHKGDAQQHAEWFIPTIRTWSSQTFYSALSESRSEEERNGIVDELFARYAKKVSENPSHHGMDYVHAYLLIRRDII